MAILGSKQQYDKENTKDIYHFPLVASGSKNALIVFTRNPELGKCKTRLAATVGNKCALDIYTFLLQHTVKITTPVKADTFVYYSVKVRENDLWDDDHFRKRKQVGSDLGIRMHNAFNEVFSAGYERAIIIGSDMYDMNTADLNKAFEQLATNDVVLGPAEDGGYYLLGLKQTIPALFHDKNWGTNSVLEDTLSNLKDKNVALLAEKNDVDYYEDIKDIDAFQKFFAHLK